MDEAARAFLAEPFAWRRGGTGTMRVTLDGGRIAHLIVAFG